ncbi:zygote arrest protein 1 isoform X1 [Synchiropus splendidus]|uniref:zygote arrest protein 1 isoform X1 n=1 Tax=Synchiropus splendidus TaxID=270530 RepID=UPI00237D54C9|nr:zygote arrest protein 1 isoform X1 [Synchiropus splendidus]
MATYGDEPVDSYFYSSHNPYTGRYPRSREPAWKYKRYLSHYGDASDAFNNQQRAQLKSILSQINPKLTPRLRKANTKDVAVQVRPKKDAAVQCSIGPRSLTAMKRDLKRKKAVSESGSPQAAGDVRYPRTLAVYSPIAYRSITSFVVEDENQAGSQGQEEVGCGESPPPPEEEPPQPPEEDPEETAKTPLQRKRAKDKLAADESTQEGSKGKARVRFQFLEQKYGYYHCRECNVRWESAYVWCVQGTNKVYFKQYCRKCQKEFNPYRVEDITCHTCQKARCCCAVTQRHVDPKRPHRQDLCGRCKGKRLSCDSTFSFKYII